MASSIRYSTVCKKVPTPGKHTDVGGSNAVEIQNQGRHPSSSFLGHHQGCQSLGNQLGAIPHGHLERDPSFDVSQSTSLHLPLYKPPSPHPHYLFNIDNTKIARVGENTFVTYDDGEVHPVLLSQPPSQTLLPAHAHVPWASANAATHATLAHASSSQAYPIHGLQAPPPGRVPLTQAPYSQALPTHGLQDSPLTRDTHAPPLAFGSATAAVTANQNALLIANPLLPNGPISEALLLNMATADVAERVNWHVRNAVKIGNIWLCPYFGCPYPHVSSKDAFKNHLNRRHYKSSERLSCPADGCNVTFGYHSEMKRHYDQFHLGIGHKCECTGNRYRRLETLKRRCALKDKCPGAVDRRVTGANAKERGVSVPSP